jgi:biopolymer transport protein ExbB
MPDFSVFKTYFDMGGTVMMPLLLVSVGMWYALVYRLMTVNESRCSPRELIAKARLGSLVPRAPAEMSALHAVRIADQANGRVALKSEMDEHMLVMRGLLGHYRVLVHVTVAVAPLLGLLGTVDGMIETFDSLGEMVLFSQTGGIAGGISKALLTTQVGLVVAIPGLLLGKVIDRREKNILKDIYQIRDLVCMGTNR